MEERSCGLGEASELLEKPRVAEEKEDDGGKRNAAGSGAGTAGP